MSFVGWVHLRTALLFLLLLLLLLLLFLLLLHLLLNGRNTSTTQPRVWLRWRAPTVQAHGKGALRTDSDSDCPRKGPSVEQP
jgi:hypothetical protein